MHAATSGHSAVQNHQAATAVNDMATRVLTATSFGHGSESDGQKGNNQ